MMDGVDGVTFTVMESEAQGAGSLLEIAAEKGVPLRADCGGKGLCHKCRVRVQPESNVSRLSTAEKNSIARGSLAPGWRLACLCRPLGPVTVHGDGYVSDEDMSVIRTMPGRSFKSQPAVIRIPIEGTRLREAADGAQGDLCSSICDNALLAKTRETPLGPVKLSALRNLSEPLVWDDGLTLVSHYKMGLIAIKRGMRPKSTGMALDLGTTTIAGYLFDHESKDILFACSGANPQVMFGSDVISRIAYAQTDGAANLRIRDILIRALESLILYGLERSARHVEDLDRLVIAGNPAMTHFFLGVNPASLGLYPYTPVISSPMDIMANEIGFKYFPHTSVHIMPSVSGFVGSDTLAAIIDRNIDRSGEKILLMDIGTNGELVLARSGRIMATSCATGPAFEGSRLSCGVRAVPGAIAKVNIDPASFQVEYETVGGVHHESPVGICGSGIVDAVAHMVKLGLVNRDGAMNRRLAPHRFDQGPQGLRFRLKGRDMAGNEVYITQKDIREIQLAKAAIASGIRILMDRAAIDAVDRVILTGAFGNAIDIKNAITLGLIPGQVVAGKYESVQNAAGYGALRTLVDRNCEERARILAESIENVDTASDERFQDIFVSETYFPL